ncbi:MAG: hypothetical protein BGO88_13240 [Flavobacterium sp. 38-13]|nr:MAG: hypothetical protein BGO88_13240 [Flavobacterium sp. 38-13]
MAKNKKITIYPASKSNKKECFIGFLRIDYFFDNEQQRLSCYLKMAGMFLTRNKCTNFFNRIF